MDTKIIEQRRCDFCYKYNAYMWIPTLEGAKKACVKCEREYFSRPLKNENPLRRGDNN